jgi:hypothetical protein
MKMHKITRQDIQRNGRIVHRVIVYILDGKKELIDHIVESLNPVDAYKVARRDAGVKGKCKVEWLPSYSEDMQAGIH